jgi:hypothetical protein
MNSTAKIVSLIALLVTIVPSVLYFLGMLDAEPMKWVALAGTIVWFVATPMWMGRETTT